MLRAEGEFKYIDFDKNYLIDKILNCEKIIENGVCIMRMQPLHNAHLYIIKTMLKMCINVTVILGSENKVDMLRNPFDIQLRKTMLMEALEEDERDRVTIFNLPDWSMESDLEEAKTWGTYLYMNIVSRIGTKKFTIFYNDDPAIIENWFEQEYLGEDRVSFFFMDRGNMFNGLSATKIREAFEEDDISYIDEYCPHSVVDRYVILRDTWLNIKKNPRDDFSMI